MDETYEAEYEVERIEDVYVEKKTTQYLVKWLGWGTRFSVDLNLTFCKLLLWCICSVRRLCHLHPFVGGLSVFCAWGVEHNRCVP